ncbi:MAG: radical SAM protein [Candidatus Omnitrophota bacterium]
MKTLLIYPPYSPLFGGYKNQEVPLSDIPLGLSYLTACLKQREHEVSVLDLNIKMYFDAKEEDKILWYRKNWNLWNIKKLFLNKVLPRIQDIEERWVEDILNSGSRIIGFYIACTSQWPALSLARKLKEKDSGIVIIFGGPGCSREDRDSVERFLRTGDVDIVVLGEGEITLLEILDSYKRTGRIKPAAGACFRVNGGIVYGGQREPIKDLDSLPYPDFSGFIDDYKALFGDKTCLSISWVRGCTHRCPFCYETRFWGYPRSRSAESICEEFIFQKEKYNVNVFFKGDSILAFSEEVLFKTCDLLIEKKADIYWGSQARLDKYLNRESLEKLYQARCRSLWYGLESGSQAVVDRMNKGFRVNEAQDIIINTKNAGIKSSITVMVGSPGETLIDFLKTAAFIMKNAKFIDDMFVTLAGVMAMTDWYLKPEQYGIMMEKKRSYFWRTRNYLNNHYVRAIEKHALDAIYKISL